MHNINNKIYFDNLTNISNYLKKYNKILIISSCGSESYYTRKIYFVIKEEFPNISINSLSIPNGEDAKSLNVVNIIWSTLSRLNFDRYSLIISVGGGCVSDTTGFAASTYMRGIDLFIIPTTLLAMVDASIGGKNAINTSFAKNSIGTFYQPNKIIMDVSTLNSLSYSEYVNGLFEAVKIALLKGKDLYDLVNEKCSDIVNNNNNNMKHFIFLCAKYKEDICNNDLFDKLHIRAILNYGHTLGHALEAASKNQIEHGYAIGLGIDFAAFMYNRLYPKNNLNVYNKQKNLLKKLCLYKFVLEIKNLITDNMINEIIKYFSHDKKLNNDKINFVFLKDIGKPIVLPININKISNCLMHYVNISKG